MPTVGEALHRATNRLQDAGIEDPRIEADALLANVLGCHRAALYAALSDQLPEHAQTAFEALLDRRSSHEPLAYITGAREFYGLDFVCAPSALIPRQETEMLVRFAVDRCRAASGEVSVADVGTGTGAIAVAVAVHAPNARITGIDASLAALDVARKNVQRHGVEDRVTLREGDLLEDRGSHDLILANLPYVSEKEWATLMPEVRDHEPRSALVPGPRGTELIERLIATAPLHLNTGGALAMEIGATQGGSLSAVARRVFPGAETTLHQDFAGLDRMLVIDTGVRRDA